MCVLYPCIACMHTCLHIMYVCVTCLCILLYACVYVNTEVCICGCVNVCILFCMYFLCINAFILVLYTRMSVCMYACGVCNVCMYVCACVRKHMGKYSCVSFVRVPVVTYVCVYVSM